MVSRIDDLGVTLQHAHGSARLRFDDLAPGEQAFFGLDPEFAAVALAEERENLVAYDRRLNLEMQAIRQDEKAALAERKAEENRSASRLAIAQASARAASVSSSPLSSSFGRLGQTSRRSYSTYYSYRRPTTRYRSVYSYGSCRRPAAAWNQYSATPIRPYQPSPCLPAFRPHAVQYFNP